MICHPCRNKNHADCTNCDCQHRTTENASGKPQPKA